MKQSLVKYYLLTILLSVAFFNACDEENPFQRRPYDFSTVPDAYDTLQAIRTQDLGQGLRVHIIEPGITPEADGVTMNDRVELFYTGRFTDGEIFDSSYRDGFTQPLSNNVTGFIDGFSFGLIGATEGEKRTIVIPPIYGYQDFSSANNTGRRFRGETLIFDIELVQILK
jgi:FKBP-type peptidyl-prolyl cis-trans isomerase